MKTIKVFEENETVWIRAKVARVIFDKDKITYELKDYNNEQPYLTRFSEKDITPMKEDEF